MKGVGSGQYGYRDMAMYLSVIHVQPVCYDTDGVLGEGGCGIFALVRGRYVRTAEEDCQLLTAPR